MRVLQAVRDEAHRFATTFHKNLRDRKVSSSVLERIKGIGKKRSKRLLERFGSIEEIRRQSPPEVAAAAGIGLEQAGELLRRLKGFTR